MIIVPFETEAKCLFGVLYMEKILGQGGEFLTVRDAAWQQAPQEIRQQMFGLAYWCDNLKPS